MFKLNLRTSTETHPIVSFPEVMAAAGYEVIVEIICNRANLKLFVF